MEEREHSVKGGATLVKMREDQDWTYCVLFVCVCVCVCVWQLS